jgi:magnesium and cobalt transporter
MSGQDQESVADTGGTDGVSEDGDASSPSLISRIFGTSERTSGQLRTDAQAASEREMLLNLRRMRDLRVEDVMVPRADIVSVAMDISLEDLVAAFRDSAHTRLPAYRETLDDPRGFVHLKDVALNYGFGATGGEFDLKALIRPMLYAPPSMPIGSLLQKMQADRVHMALVIDEYGGVDGLITIEDLLEQIVGDIEDEHDVAEGAAFLEESDGVYLCNSRTELPEFEAVAGVDLLPDDLDEEVDTLGGLVFMFANRIPTRGEVIAHPDGHEFEVVDADSRRIKRLRVRLEGRSAATPPEARAAE